jgi:hypothetical protein
MSTTTLQSRLKVQLNTTLFAKCLVRKDVASSSSTSTSSDTNQATAVEIQGSNPSSTQEEFASKAQIMTLMTTDVDRVADFAWHIFSLVGK